MYGRVLSYTAMSPGRRTAWWSPCATIEVPDTWTARNTFGSWSWRAWAGVRRSVVGVDRADEKFTGPAVASRQSTSICGPGRS